MKKITLIVFFLISAVLFAQSSDSYRFYDFGVEIDFRHGIMNDDFKIIFPNGFENDHLKENFLYRIDYAYNKERNRVAIDTSKIELSKAEMDNLFELTSKQFQIGFRENLSESKIPPAPIIYDGMAVDLTFDLMFRGDVYSRSWRYPFKDKTFVELSDFIEELFNNK